MGFFVSDKDVLIPTFFDSLRYFTSKVHFCQTVDIGIKLEFVFSCCGCEFTSSTWAGY